ncbi:MAG: efflux RND transporter periplasmic adaptor subunit [Desulfomonile tiedjei]|nr:efflux RND transporter periplasmic adaptor subunit [Desulfomonile tiedjei]
MRLSVRRVMWVWWVLLCVLPAQLPALAQEERKATPPPVSAPGAVSGSDSDLEAEALKDLNLSRSEGISAVIYPYQSATVGTEVRGIVDSVNFKEGDSVSKGSVVAEISKARYASMVGEFRGNYDAVVRSLNRAREELTVQEELYDKRATTYDDLLKARSQVQVLEARKEEALNKLKQAELNLDACVLKAPFSGTVAVLYHEPFEAVDNLEKVFGLIDTAKVYARANWPESRLSELATGKKAAFHYEGKAYEGVIEKISSLIDPASKSKRVHILIDNPKGKLEVGMSGAVSLADAKKLSMGTTTPPEEN